MKTESPHFHAGEDEAASPTGDHFRVLPCIHACMHARSSEASLAAIPRQHHPSSADERRPKPRHASRRRRHAHPTEPCMHSCMSLAPPSPSSPAEPAPMPPRSTNLATAELPHTSSEDEPCHFRPERHQLRRKTTRDRAEEHHHRASLHPSCNPPATPSILPGVLRFTPAETSPEAPRRLACPPATAPPPVGQTMKNAKPLLQPPSPRRSTQAPPTTSMNMKFLRPPPINMQDPPAPRIHHRSRLPPRHMHVSTPPLHEKKPTPSFRPSSDTGKHHHQPRRESLHRARPNHLDSTQPTRSFHAGNASHRVPSMLASPSPSIPASNLADVRLAMQDPRASAPTPSPASEKNSSAEPPLRSSPLHACMQGHPKPRA